MFKNIISASLLFNLAFFTNAETTEMQQLQQKLVSISGFSAQFKQQVIDSKKQVVQMSNGQIDLVQPDKFKWLTGAPNENLLQSDGKTVWFYDPFVEQVTAYDLSETIKANPILLLMEPNSKAWQQYQVKKLDQNQYEVLPTDKDSQIVKLSLIFSEQSKIESLQILDRQGQTSLYQLSNFKAKALKDFEANFFDFVMPIGADLDDQRQ